MLISNKDSKKVTALIPKTAMWQTQAFKSEELTEEQVERVEMIFNSKDIGINQKFMLIEDFFLRNMADKLDSLCNELEAQSYMKEYVSGVRHARLALLNHLSSISLVRVGVRGEEQ